MLVKLRPTFYDQKKNSMHFYEYNSVKSSMSLVKSSLSRLSRIFL